MFDQSPLSAPVAAGEPQRIPSEPAWRLHAVSRFRGRPGEIANEGPHHHTSIRYIAEGHATAWIDGVLRKLGPRDACIVHCGASVQFYNDPAHPISGIAIDCSGPLIEQLLCTYQLRTVVCISQASIGPAVRSLAELSGDCLQRRAGLALHELLATLGDQVQQRPELPEVVRMSKAYIDDNIDSQLRLADVARHARCSEAHLSRMFRRFVGVPPGDYCLRQRMILAKRLLQTTEDPIKAIASRLGYRDSFAFSHAFKNVVGSAPTFWRSATQRSQDLARAS